MTNQIQDAKMSDCFMVCGSNAAENHPITFKWIEQAMNREKNPAPLIVVDPRFTRTASKATIFAQTRPGTDIVFFGALIKYAIDNNMVNWDYVKAYTNASALVNPGYSFNPETGLFSGFKETVNPKTGKKTKKYDTTTWSYQTGPDGKPVKDPTLANPQCVWQQLIKHYGRYTPEKVEEVCGIPQAKFEEVAKTYCSTYQKGKSGVLLYAMGLTQHTYGTQNIRTFAVLQLILGNMGVPGGGIDALRGCANVQGSTDQALLYHILPGYNPMPNSTKNPTLAAYNEARLKAVGSAFWNNTPKFMASYFRAMYGDNAKPENEWGYKWFPRVKDGANYSHMPLFEAMYAGTLKGLFVIGQNPAVGGPNANMETKAMEKLEWLVVSEIFNHETPNFWQRPGADPAAIKTEVFLLPACTNGEYEGTFANTGRVVQWFYQSGSPKGESKKDVDMLTLILQRLMELYKEDDQAPNREAILNLYWPYGENANMEEVLAELNGFDWNTKKRVKNFTALKDDGSTACGNWVYSGVYPEEADYPGMDKPETLEAAKASFAKTKGNLSKRTNNEDKGNVAIYPSWAWCWPINRRIVYNRCSCDPAGQPWSADKNIAQWNGTKWVMVDVADFKATDSALPGNPPVPPDVSAANPFLMLNYGMGQLFSIGIQSSVLTDGPFPEHYEPIETPFRNVMNGLQNNPIAKIFDSEMDRLAEVGDPKYPIIAGTSRVTEHFQSGTMTRNMPWLAEMQPNMLVEMSKDLAKRKGIENGDWVKIKSIRGETEAVALVTDRMQVLKVNGKDTDVVNMPYHFGYKGLYTGGPKDISYAGNVLTPNVGDANTSIPESKVFLVDIEKA